MQLKMLKTLSGADGVKHRGDIHDFDDAEGQRLVDAEIATEDLDAVVKIHNPRRRTEPAEPFIPDPPSGLPNGNDDNEEELEPVDVAELAAMKRPELDELAAKAGIEDPAALPNKGAVIDAIVEKVGVREESQ